MHERPTMVNRAIFLRVPAMVSIWGIIGVAVAAVASANPSSAPAGAAYGALNVEALEGTQLVAHDIQGPLPGRFGGDMRRQTSEATETTNDDDLGSTISLAGIPRWDPLNGCRGDAIPCVEALDDNFGVFPRRGSCCQSADASCKGVISHGTCSTEEKDCTANGNPNTVSLFVEKKRNFLDILVDFREHMCCMDSKLPYSAGDKGACCIWPLGFGKCVQPGDELESEGCCPYCPAGEVLCYSSPKDASCMNECGAGMCKDRNRFMLSKIDGKDTYVFKPGGCESTEVTDRDLPRIMEPIYEPWVVIFFIINTLMALKGLQEATLESKEVDARLANKDPFWSIMAFDFDLFVSDLRLINSSPMSSSRYATRTGNLTNKFAHSAEISVGIISIVFSIMRLFEWSFIFCDNSKCRKTASAFVFTSLDLFLQTAAFEESTILRSAVMYSSSSELDILLKAALDALGAASNIAWVFYEMYGSSSDVTGPGTLVMWILSPIIVVLFTVHILKRNIGARSNGFHTMLEAFPVTGRSWWKAARVAENLRKQEMSCRKQLESDLLGDEERKEVQDMMYDLERERSKNDVMRSGPMAFEYRAQLQQKQKEAFGEVTDLYRLEDSEILRKLDYRTYLDSGRVVELFHRIKEVTSRSGNLNDEDDNPVFDPKPDILERLKIWLAKAEETAESIREKIKEARHKSQLLNDARPGDGSAASQLNSLQTRSIGVHSVIPGPIPTSAGYPGQYYSGAPSFSSVYGQPGADAATGGFRSGSPPMAGVNSGPHIPGFSSSTAPGPFLSFGPRHGAQLGSLT